MEGIHEIRDKQNEVFRYVNFDPVECMNYKREVYQTPLEWGMRRWRSHTSLRRCAKRVWLIWAISVTRQKRYGNGYYADGLYLTVMHRPEDNGLDFSFEHQVKAYSRETLELFYYYMCKIMFKESRIRT